MSGAGLASAIKRRTRPPEENRAREVTFNESNNISRQIPGQQSGQQPRQFNPTQILYNHDQKLKQIEELLNSKVNLDIDNNSSNLTKTEDFDKKIDDKIKTSHEIINKNMMFIMKNLENNNHMNKSNLDNFNNYKSENELRMTELMNNFTSLNDILMKSLEEFKKFNDSKQDIINEVVAELIRQSNLPPIDENRVFESPEEQSEQVEQAEEPSEEPSEEPNNKEPEDKESEDKEPEDKESEDKESEDKNENTN